jgi:hypothetical protein
LSDKQHCALELSGAELFLFGGYGGQYGWEKIEKLDAAYGGWSQYGRKKENRLHPALGVTY